MKELKNGDHANGTVIAANGNGSTAIKEVAVLKCKSDTTKEGR